MINPIRTGINPRAIQLKPTNVDSSTQGFGSPLFAKHPLGQRASAISVDVHVHAITPPKDYLNNNGFHLLRMAAFLLL
ncbi:MAG: hypothetical protein H8E29_03955 [Anaerolineales bacterium]|uniref:Uncharacterized protein n=1 Tax=Candidatus Desulfolinea nitratireducens TaxID=2841698 RepID=A0A8J6NIR8_9CHLR|nr:hypothetical protein [Candidatus Desulfolinea nitratireducens]